MDVDTAETQATMARAPTARGWKFLVGLFAAVGVAATLGGLGFVLGGVSARPAPSPLETRLARSARHLMIPAAARARANPVAADAASIARGRAHFADHCATCHGNDGRGDTPYGRRLSPRAPDMTAPSTQALSDGELFWIIENGVRLTGMPGFGSGEAAEAVESWELVRFIRTLPRLTPGEIHEMERLNPTLSHADVARERAEEEFLAGGEAPAPTHHH